MTPDGFSNESEPCTTSRRRNCGATSVGGCAMRFLARGTLDVIGPIPLCPKTNVTVSTKTMLKKRCRTVRMQTPLILCLRWWDGAGGRVARGYALQVCVGLDARGDAVRSHDG